MGAEKFKYFSFYLTVYTTQYIHIIIIIIIVVVPRRDAIVLNPVARKQQNDILLHLTI